ncbi:conserved hypothetical protein [Aspergillus terreus NIH2624]|uniref:Phosphoglycerate mutase family protein n=1 Tax=Aspergillus terreus (strain NIH 2624 / FGSC A1156) TaxID=341663 RepID=Q0CM64_ASPTN|nr:uncharacterized protein ATEG_05220 [Aspergillus terreus NIH2624]EAU34289.1 conserved hypothetical protein [Aspergillus terreus NIH2624]
MPLDTIYLTRHGHRLNWTIDYKTGEYKSQFPTPTGNPADPTLTSHGVRQSFELAAHFVSPAVHPKPFRVYSSPFYRCLQTIQPAVEALKEAQQRQLTTGTDHGIDAAAELDVRIENGVGEWFGPTSFFHHPSPASPADLKSHFPNILAADTTAPAHVYPSTRGETIAQLHDRLATTLAAIIADVDAEIAQLERTQPPSSKAILICSHAAPLIAIGRVLTGRMPDDSGEEDFNVFTAGLSTFVRRGAPAQTPQETQSQDVLAPGTRIARPDVAKVPCWKGIGVAGGWDCVANGDCSFLSGGAERGCGEESFDTGPMAPPSELPTSSQEAEWPGTKL